MNIKNIALIVFTVVIGFSGFAQTEEQIEDIDFGIQKWFYNQYPKSSEAVWSKLYSASNTDRYQVSFKFEGATIIAVYDEKGKRLSEQKSVNVPHISIINYVEDNYDKPKIKEVTMKTNFVSNELTYLVDLKSKSNGSEVILFDEKLNRISQDYISSSN
ncbi:MAG: hypothetical protein RIC03_05285 [Cyclobacteriaceae bacterium]